MAHAMVHRAEIVICIGRGKTVYSLIVLLWMLAQDSYEHNRRSPLQPAMTDHVCGAGSGFLEQLKYYQSQDFWACADFSSLIVEHELRSAQQFFEGSMSWANFGIHFVSPQGQRKLKTDWPNIWEDLDLEAHSNLES